MLLVLDSFSNPLNWVETMSVHAAKCFMFTILIFWNSLRKRFLPFLLWGASPGVCVCVCCVALGPQPVWFPLSDPSSLSLCSNVWQSSVAKELQLNTVHIHTEPCMGFQTRKASALFNVSSLWPFSKKMSITKSVRLLVGLGGKS